MSPETPSQAPNDPVAAVVKGPAGAIPLVANDDHPDAEAAHPVPPSTGAAKSKARRASAPRDPADVQEGSAPGPDGVTMPAGFSMEWNGLFYDMPGGGGPLFVSSPFKVLGMGRTPTGGEWGLVIEFKDPDGTLKELEVPQADVVGDQTIILKKLAAKGLQIATSKSGREKLLTFFGAIRPKARVTFAETIGWLSGESKAFVLPSETIGNAGGPVLLRKPARGGHFEAAGELSGWQEWIKRDVQDHDLPVFALAVSLSAPLARLAGIDPASFHLVGRSSAGKSSVLGVASSVYGSPRYSGTWSVTAGGLEVAAAAHNDCAICLDELGQVDPRALGPMIYMLSGGQGRQRMRADGSIKALIRFCVTVLSSGELDAEAKIREAPGQTPMAGHTVRLITLRIDPARVSGVFDGSESSAFYDALAKRIKSSCAKNFGTAGPAFIKAIAANPEDHLADLRLMMDDFIARHLPSGASGQVSRVLTKFAFVAAAGELGVTDSILPFKPGRVEEAAARLFANWLAARGGTGAAEDRQALSGVRDFIEQHSNARFVRLDASDVSWRAQYLAGYSDADWFYFTDGAFREALGGLDPRTAAEALLAANYFVRDGRNLKCKVKTPKGRQRLYKISARILDWDDEAVCAPAANGEVAQ